MITLSANLLVENPEVRARYQYQFEYVLIDEYQDASAQWISRPIVGVSTRQLIYCRR